MRNYRFNDNAFHTAIYQEGTFEVDSIKIAIADRLFQFH
ncbi:hypothetical protein SAMN05428978_1002105 [Nitrosomonas sp. Nm34]|nr:hypothetical protein SAMN05428978_1002105 [Nitrosomonas sp. Nm34]